MKYMWLNRKQSRRTMENINYERDNDNRSNWWKWRWKSVQVKLENIYSSSDFVTNDCSQCASGINCNFIHRQSNRSSDKSEDVQKQSGLSSQMSTNSCVTFILLVILTFLMRSAEAYPTSDCDWTGSGSRETIVQAVYLRCQRGQITWENPRGGLRVNISPPTAMLPFSHSKSASLPYRLCLESTKGKNYRVFLEQSGAKQRKLLPFIAPDSESTVAATSSSSKCYRISTTTATLYIESMSTLLSPEAPKANSGEQILPGGHYNKLLLHSSSITSTNHNEDQNHKTNPNGNDDDHHSQTIKQQVKISYEIELIRESSKQSQSKSPSYVTDDECRPCSDDEVLQLYCVADVVARGEILSVSPSHVRRNSDMLHIKSDLVIHQNHPVFQPLKPGNRNLQKFLAEDVHTFDENSPKKAQNSKGVTKTFGGVVAHPTKCAAQSGPGDFLWLIKLSFGRPKIGCVIYWDKWAKIAKAANEDGSASCPLVF